MELPLGGDGGGDWLDTATVTAQGPSSRSTRRARDGDLHPAISGDFSMAASGDFGMATDRDPRTGDRDGRSRSHRRGDDRREAGAPSRRSPPATSGEHEEEVRAALADRRA